MLEGCYDGRNICLTGNVSYANVKIITNATEDLSPNAGIDLTMNDTRYLRNWKVTQPVDFPFGKDIIMPLPSAFGDLQKSELPDTTVMWKSIEAEYRAIVNLNRIYKSGVRDQRRLEWLKTTIRSEKEQVRTL